MKSSSREKRALDVALHLTNHGMASGSLGQDEQLPPQFRG